MWTRRYFHVMGAKSKHDYGNYHEIWASHFYRSKIEFYFWNVGWDLNRTFLQIQNQNTFLNIHVRYEPVIFTDPKSKYISEKLDEIWTEHLYRSKTKIHFWIFTWDLSQSFLQIQNQNTFLNIHVRYELVIFTDPKSNYISERSMETWDEHF